MVPWDACLAVSYGYTLTHARCSHRGAVSLHAQQSHSHTKTCLTTSSFRYIHTASALTHLGRGKAASFFLSMSWRVGRAGGGGDGERTAGAGGGGGDERGGGTRWLSALTPGTEGGGQEGKERGKWGVTGKGDSRGTLIRKNIKHLSVRIHTLI